MLGITREIKYFGDNSKKLNLIQHKPFPFGSNIIPINSFRPKWSTYLRWSASFPFEAGCLTSACRRHCTQYYWSYWFDDDVLVLGVDAYIPIVYQFVEMLMLLLVVENNLFNRSRGGLRIDKGSVFGFLDGSPHLILAYFGLFCVKNDSLDALS